MELQYTHKKLTEIAVKWLKRPNSAGGHGCQLAVSEGFGGWSGEIPDAIGFRHDHFGCQSVLVEVKVSRVDFLSDKKKPHRNGQVLGMGNFRYYLCPEGLILPDEIPEKWGLLWVNKRGHIKPQISPFLCERYDDMNTILDAMHFESNSNREMVLMMTLLARLADPEAVNLKIRDLRNTLNRVNTKKTALEVENKEIRLQARRLQSALIENNIEIDTDPALVSLG